MRHLPTLISLLALSTAGLAYAEEAAIEGQTIIVTGTRDGYRTIDTTSGTKTKTLILDVPQTIDVVTEEQIRDQSIRSMTDLVRLLPGVSAGQGEGHRDQITLRGNPTTADFFVDGLRDDVQYFRSFYNVDRVEVHKGPNAMVFGRGGGGGIVNRILKGALIGENVGNVTASVDSFGSWYGAADANIALGSAAALRLNGFYEALDNHRDAFGGNRLGVNPVVGFDIDGRTRVQVGYEYVHDARGVDRGIPSVGTGTIGAPVGPLTGYRNIFFGARGANRGKFDAHMLRFRSETDLAEGLTLSTQALFADTDKIYSNAYPATSVTAASVGIEAYRDIVKRRSLIGQTNLEWRANTGGIKHIVLIGAEFTTQDTYSERINGFFPTATSPLNRRVTLPLAPTIVVPEPTFIAGVTGPGNRQIDGDLSQYSFYIQDQITLIPELQAIAGLRYDKLRNDVFSRFVTTNVRRTDDLWSPRAGLVFKPVPTASIYVSWAKSFLPQSGDQFVTFDATFAALEPEAFNNYELGAKWDVKPGLTLTTAIYRLDRSNTRAANPISGGPPLLTGGQRTEGFEIALSGRITPKWQTAMAYARTVAKISSTTTAAPAGREVAQVPRDQLSLWNRYDVTDRVGVGLGIFHQAGQFTTISNLVRIPAYTRIDAALFVKLTDQISAQVNVENVGNITYFPTAHTDNNITTGAPRNVRFTLTSKF